MNTYTNEELHEALNTITEKIGEAVTIPGQRLGTYVKITTPRTGEEQVWEAYPEQVQPTGQHLGNAIRLNALNRAHGGSGTYDVKTPDGDDITTPTTPIIFLDDETTTEWAANYTTPKFVASLEGWRISELAKQLADTTSTRLDDFTRIEEQKAGKWHAAELVAYAVAGELLDYLEQHGTPDNVGIGVDGVNGVELIQHTNPHEENSELLTPEAWRKNWWFTPALDRCMCLGVTLTALTRAVGMIHEALQHYDNETNGLEAARAGLKKEFFNLSKEANLPEHYWDSYDDDRLMLLWRYKAALVAGYGEQLLTEGADNPELSEEQQDGVFTIKELPHDYEDTVKFLADLPTLSRGDGLKLAAQLLHRFGGYAVPITEEQKETILFPGNKYELELHEVDELPEHGKQRRGYVFTYVK